MKALSVVHSFICAICVATPALAADAAPPASTPASTAPASAPPTSTPTSDAICHRVSEGKAARVYCGSARQWADLRSRVGFRCRNEGKKDELCAAASEWKRLDLNAASKRAREVDTRQMIDAFSERSRQPENLTPMTGSPNVNAPMQGN